MEKEKQNWFRTILSNEPAKLIEKTKTTSMVNVNLARAFLIFTILLLSITLVSAANVTAQTGNLNVGNNLTVAGTSLTVNTKEVCLSDGTNCQSVGMDYTNLAMTNKSNTFGAFDQIFDTSTFKIDALNNKVGIGTASPWVDLHINDANGSAELYLTGTSGNAAAVMVLQDLTNNVKWYLENRQVDSNHFYLESYDGTSWRVPFKVSLTAPTNTLYLSSAGNVGIGTSSPNQALTIAGNINFTSGYNIYSAGALSLNPTYLILPDNLDRYVSTSAKYFGRDTTGGYNVSIGFTASNAQSQLKVYGKGYGGGGYIGLTHDMTDGKITTSLGDIILEPQTGKVGIGTTAPAYLLDVRGNVSLNSSLYVTTSGNVGIGTTSPGNRLHVDYDSGGANNPVAFFEGGSTNGDNSEIIVGAAALDAYALVLGYLYTGNVLTNYGYLKLFGGTTALTWLNNGYVGMGTATPTEKLNVVGNANITGNVSSNGRNLDTYVVRNPSSWDFTTFTTTGGWITDGMDLSSIVPAGAKAVHLSVQIRDDAVSTFSIRQNSTNTYNQISLIALGNYLLDKGEIIAIDSDRKLDYRASDVAWTSISVVVLGWWI